MTQPTNPVARAPGSPDRYRRRIQFRDTDAAGIAHFSTFFLFMEEAEHEFLRARGLSVLMRDAEGAISWPRVAVKCDYASPVKFEDMLEIDVALTRIGDKSAAPPAPTPTSPPRDISAPASTSKTCAPSPASSRRSHAATSIAASSPSKTPSAAASPRPWPPSRSSTPPPCS